MSHRIDAVVVGLQDYGESDRIARLLTAEHGRVDALARRARSSRKRFAGTLETGNHLQVELKASRGSLAILKEAWLVDGHLHIRSDLDRLALAAFATELCSSPARHDHAEPRLFGLLLTALTVLDATEGVPADAFRAGLVAKALTFAGLLPHLVRCHHCGQPVSDAARWSPLHGGAHHPECVPGGTKVSAQWLQAVEAARRTPLRELVDTPLPSGPLTSLTHPLEDTLNRPLKSRALLDQLRAGALPAG